MGWGEGGELHNYRRNGVWSAWWQYNDSHKSDCLFCLYFSRNLFGFCQSFRYFVLHWITLSGLVRYVTRHLRPVVYYRFLLFSYLNVMKCLYFIKHIYWYVYFVCMCISVCRFSNQGNRTSVDIKTGLGPRV